MIRIGYAKPGAKPYRNFEMGGRGNCVILNGATFPPSSCGKVKSSKRGGSGQQDPVHSLDQPLIVTNYD